MLGTDTLPAQSAPNLPPVPAPERRRVLSPNNASPEEKDLTHNYQLVFGFKDGGKPAQEIALLTASSQISVSACLAAKDESQLGMPTATIQGFLAEKDNGVLRLSYQIGASIPVPTQSMVSKPGSGEPKPVIVNISYTNESASGVLLLQPGKTYEIFKTGERTYTVTIQPEPAQGIK